jgi:hypothetical protein
VGINQRGQDRWVSPLDVPSTDALSLLFNLLMIHVRCWPMHASHDSSRTPAEPHHAVPAPQRSRTHQSQVRQACHLHHIGCHLRRHLGLRWLAWHHQAQRWRQRCRDTRAPRSRSYGHLRRRQRDVQAGGISGPRHLSHVLEKALRKGGFVVWALRARLCLGMWCVMLRR